MESLTSHVQSCSGQFAEPGTEHRPPGHGWHLALSETPFSPTPVQLQASHSLSAECPGPCPVGGSFKHPFAVPLLVIREPRAGSWDALDTHFVSPTGMEAPGGQGSASSPPHPRHSERLDRHDG